jgi:hypothetical protein
MTVATSTPTGLRGWNLYNLREQIQDRTEAIL